MWETRPLSDVTTKIGSGATPRGGKNVYQDRGVAFVRSQNVLDHSMRLDDVARLSHAAASTLGGATIERGDVLINITGDSVARCCQVDSVVLPARVSQHVAIVRPAEGLNAGYLQKALVLRKAELLAMSRGGGTRKALTKAMLERFEIAVPPLNEQRAITEILGALDDKIAANEGAITAAERFVIAVVATIDGTVPLSSFAGHLSKTVPVKTFANEVAHFSLPAFDDGGRPDLVAGVSIKSNKTLMDRPVVLISKLNPRIPRVWDVPVTPDRMSLASTEFVMLAPHDGNTTALWAALQQPFVSTALSGLVAGTSGSHQRVKPAEVLSLEVPDLASLSDAWAAECDALGRLIASVRAQSAVLTRTRDHLMPLLLSGRLRVQDAERTIEEVL